MRWGTHFTGEKMNTEPSREGGGVKKEGAEARSGELFFFTLPGVADRSQSNRSTRQVDRQVDRQTDGRGCVGGTITATISATAPCNWG